MIRSALQGNRASPIFQPRLALVLVRALRSIQIRIRCQMFFTAAGVMTISVIIAAALLSSAGRVFLGIMVGWNVVQGVLLTYDVREWPHRLQEVLPYCAYYCESNLMGAGKNVWLRGLTQRFKLDWRLFWTKYEGDTLWRVYLWTRELDEAIPDTPTSCDIQNDGCWCCMQVTSSHPIGKKHRRSPHAAPLAVSDLTPSSCFFFSAPPGIQVPSCQ